MLSLSCSSVSDEGTKTFVLFTTGSAQVGTQVFADEETAPEEPR